MKYATILADPPWMERGGGKCKRGADRHYPLLKTEEIMTLPVESLAEDNAHLYLWVTNNHLKDGLRVMEAWGFDYKTMITWAKDRMGIGQYFRGMTEHVLFGVKGMIPYRVKADGKRAQGRTVIHAPKGEHSEKPEELRAMVQVVSPGPYLELFARQKYPGWHAWGNEVESDVVMPGFWSVLGGEHGVRDPYFCKDCGQTRDGSSDHHCPNEPNNSLKGWRCETCGGNSRCRDGIHRCPDDLKDKCPHCSNMKLANSIMCRDCFREYREDPDAFK